MWVKLVPNRDYNDPKNYPKKGLILITFEIVEDQFGNFHLSGTKWASTFIVGDLFGYSLYNYRSFFKIFQEHI